jgi:hypothetical protein
MNDSAIATAADYADAMLTARSAKNALFLLLLVVLLLQIAIFFLYRYEVVQFTPNIVRHTASATTTTTTAPTTSKPTVELLLTYFVGTTEFLGVVFSIILSIVLLLLINIMLVGRLIGVSRVTSAYIWTLVFLVLIFPWQAFLDAYEFKLPGVLYTWQELISRARWHDVTINQAIQNWARFVVMPVTAVIILMAIQIKSVRGIRQALGEGTELPTR